jgi:hypothetical protein
MKGAGGTPGGLGMFLIGGAMIVAGGYWLLTHVTVTSGGWMFWGYDAFGLSLVPLLIGVAMLFFNGRSVPGWLLTGAGAIIILAGVIANMRIYFRSTSLFDTLLMLGLIAAGVGMVAKSVQSQGAEEPSRESKTA